MDENKDVIIEETKASEKTDEKTVFVTAGKTGWGKRSVSRRFLIAALAIAVVANAAVSAGAMALISKGGKPSKPEKSVTGDKGNGSSDNDFDGRYFDPFSDGDGNQYGDRYYYPFGDQNNNGYGDQYSNGNGNQYYDPYEDQYNNGDSENGQNRSSGASIGIVISENSGVYVAQVTGSNAKQAGFAEGDKIVSIDGKNIGNSSDLISEVQSHKAGDTVTVVVERNGQSMEIKTVLE